MFQIMLTVKWKTTPQVTAPYGTWRTKLKLVPWEKKAIYNLGEDSWRLFHLLGGNATHIQDTLILKNLPRHKHYQALTITRTKPGETTAAFTQALEITRMVCVKPATLKLLRHQGSSLSQFSALYMQSLLLKLIWLNMISFREPRWRRE